MESRKDAKIAKMNENALQKFRNLSALGVLAREILDWNKNSHPYPPLRALRVHRGDYLW